MRVQKITRSIDSGKSAILYDQYVALEWSLKTMAIAHMSHRDDHPRIFERETDLKELKQYLGSFKGRTIMTLEESGTAHWLYLELLDCVARIIVCDQFHNRLLWHGPRRIRSTRESSANCCGQAFSRRSTTATMECTNSEHWSARIRMLSVPEFAP